MDRRFLDTPTVDAMLSDVRLVEGNFGDLRDDIQSDLCCHIKALADDRDKLVAYVHHLQTKLGRIHAILEAE